MASTTCEYCVWLRSQHFIEVKTKRGVERKPNPDRPCRHFNTDGKLTTDDPDCYREMPCGQPGRLYQVDGQTGDLFMFRGRGMPGPVVAPLCLQHAEKLVAQGFKVLHDITGAVEEEPSHLLAEGA